MELIPTIVRHAADRSALSDELHFAARGEAERAILDHGRANLLRGLDVSPSASVLEVGSGHGELTRYLGETVTAVDAVEPTADLVQATRERTEGLDSVRVLHGALADLPADRQYDLALVAGEFAEPAASNPGFLYRLRQRLRAGGTLCLALGEPGRPATNRSTCTAALRQAGFDDPLLLDCFPHHRIVRTMLTAQLRARHPRLAEALQAEPASTGPRRDDRVDSFLVLATNGTAAEPVRPLWPPERLATYFNTAERAAAWCTKADVTRVGEGAEVRRTPLQPAHPSVEGIAVRECTEPVYDAPTITSLLLEQPWRVDPLLAEWRALLDMQEPLVGPALWDLLPHNVLVDGDRLRPIDLEWENARAGPEEVAERGVLVLAHHLCAAGWSGAAPGSTTRETAGWLGVLIGLKPGFVERAVERESHFAAIGASASVLGTRELREEIRAIWLDRLAQRIDAAAEHEPRPMNRTIAPADPAFDGDLRDYFGWARDAAHLVRTTLTMERTAAPTRILDLGCGYGRELRALRAAFPEAIVLAEDEDPDAVRFCVAELGATELEGPGQVELLWCGTRFRTLDAAAWRPALQDVAARLAPDGLAFLGIPGRRAAERFEIEQEKGDDYPVSPAWQALIDYRTRGFGHWEGFSLSTPDWTVRQVLAQPSLRLAGYHEAALGELLDVIVLRRAQVTEKGEGR
ncbi:methyltransferase domain-containing protein [Amycolatopsis aidingensis]|uniref:methyltransferase domain-containing protein n=1 Tax=Amycolatopsis aidingensis TaxID=2842453 RepID=UPI001C0E077E|nr:methyltransferase domain-containing protein [Amycolatopsis aidingensis]